ncbi:MAG: histidine--tRNA ligase, partial [Symbiobacteriaceae bacterium]|nr:histidine--tRNA ligase [Symbiobacteriaceae bacterium]
MITAPRGVHDILPEQSSRWRWLEEQFVEVCRLYGFQEIRLPYFESTELFQRGVGEATDIVRKEMYTFDDRSQRSLTLRPEITAGIVRALIEHKLYAEAMPLKLFTYGALFRYERPQSGRYRQFHQFDIEIFGTASPLADAEIIAVGMDLFHRIGLADIEVQLNSIGCAVCRPVHRQAILEYLSQRLNKLCADCQSRYQLNPLRVFDCKNEACQAEFTELPLMKDYLCDDCREHLSLVKTYLEDLGIGYVMNDRLVRGLDYYNRTVFEYYDPQTREIGALGGGGRYDPLVAELGGPQVPGAGYGLGIERILISLEQRELPQPKLDIYIAALGEDAQRQAVKMLHGLRGSGISGEMDLQHRGLKAQMRQAD